MSDLVGELTQMWSPIVPPSPVAASGPKTVRRMTRWRAGATTWSGPGRVLITVLIGGGWLLPFVLLAVTTVGPLLLMTYTIITLPGTMLILRDVWKRDLVVEPLPPLSECATCGAPRRQGGHACHVCFSAYEPRPERIYSRTQAGPTSLGPLARWLATMALFAAYFFGLIFASVLGPAAMIVYSGAFAIACVMLLPEIWKRARTG